VLDIACGTGVVTRLAAERVATGRVVGLDSNAGMLAVARSVSKTAAASIEWLEGSALSLPFGSDSFDLVLCQLGLQFFPVRPLVGTLMTREGFERVNVSTVTKRITFPFIVDYVRFQLVATPMVRLLSDRNAVERESLIAAVASDTQSLLDPEMLRDGRLSFPQEAHVAIAHSLGNPARVRPAILSACIGSMHFVRRAWRARDGTFILKEGT
jgi:SAM-dependent methyltransferase